MYYKYEYLNLALHTGGVFLYNISLIKNEWSYTSTAPCVFIAWTGTSLFLCCDGHFQLVCRNETQTRQTRIFGPGSIFPGRTSSHLAEVAMQHLCYIGRRRRKRCA